MNVSPTFLTALLATKGRARQILFSSVSTERKCVQNFDLLYERERETKSTNQIHELTWSSLSIWSLTSFIPSPSPMPPPSMSSNSVAPSSSPSSISGGRQNPFEARSVKILSSTDNSLLVARWAASKFTRRCCERFRYWWRSGMVDPSNSVHNPINGTRPHPLAADPAESAMSFNRNIRPEIASVTLSKPRLLISYSKFWWRRVVKCPSWSCRYSKLGSRKTK